MFKNIFKSRSLGLDIGDESIKFIELYKTKKGIKIGRFGEREIPTGVVESGEVRDTEKMKEILKLLKKEHKIKFVYPILSPELRAQAIVAAVVKKDDPGAYMIVDLNKKHASVFVVSGGAIRYFSVLDIDGVASVDLRDEIMRHFIYWHTHKNEDFGNKIIIEKIILCGGGFDLIKLSEYFSTGLKTNVEVANVWTNILDTEKDIPEMSFEESFKFASALGFALKKFK